LGFFLHRFQKSWAFSLHHLSKKLGFFLHRFQKVGLLNDYADFINFDLPFTKKILHSLYLV